MDVKLPGTVLLVFDAIGALAVSCSHGQPQPARKDSEPQPDSIGAATMKPDGTIILRLRAEGSHTIGDGTVEYAPNNPHYQEVLQHLGGLHPGETKSVPPWPDQ